MLLLTLWHGETRQVDDLQSIDELELYVDQSAAIFLIMSKGYFLSANCMREVCANQRLELQTWLQVV